MNPKFTQETWKKMQETKLAGIPVFVKLLTICKVGTDGNIIKYICTELRWTWVNYISVWEFFSLRCVSAMLGYSGQKRTGIFITWFGGRRREILVLLWIPSISDPTALTVVLTAGIKTDMEDTTMDLGVTTTHR